MSALPILQEDNWKLRELINKVDDLAVLPHVVFKVLELSGSSDTAAAAMERAITVDPGFSSKVLVLANSASYALPKKVTSIKEAILFLGFKSVRYLAMTVGVFDLFVGKTDKESLRRRTWWRQSVDTAVCCRWLATEKKCAPPDEAYTSGLLHLIGKTLLDRFGQGDYDDVTNLVDGGMDELEAERKVYGCNHVEVAMTAARKWHFPEALVSGLDYLDSPSDEDPFRFHRAVVALSSHIAALALMGRSADDSEAMASLPAWARNSLGVSEDHVPSMIERGTAAIASSRPQV